MIFKRLLAAVSLSLAMQPAFAEIPSGYYSAIDGKQGNMLEKALQALSEGHVRITYSTKIPSPIHGGEERTVTSMHTAIFSI